MRRAKDCAPARQGAEARGVTKTLNRSVPQRVAAGKAVAVLRYCSGARSLSDTQAAFAQHPEWRGA